MKIFVTLVFASSFLFSCKAVRSSNSAALDADGSPTRGVCAFYGSNRQDASLDRLACVDNDGKLSADGTSVSNRNCHIDNEAALVGSSSRAMFKEAKYLANALSCADRSVPLRINTGDGMSDDANGVASVPLGACAFYGSNRQGEGLDRYACVDNDRNKSVDGTSVSNRSCFVDNEDALWGKTSRAMYKEVRFFKDALGCDDRRVSIRIDPDQDDSDNGNSTMKGACAFYSSNQPSGDLNRHACVDNVRNLPPPTMFVTSMTCYIENEATLRGQASRAMYAEVDRIT